MAELLPYHPKLVALLQENPAKGHGHHWFYKLSLHLRHYHNKKQAFSMLRACADSWGDRVVPDAEIWKAVEKAFSCSGEERDDVITWEWPRPDKDAIYEVVRNTEALELRDTGATTEQILAALFAPDELVCAGLSNESAGVETRDGILRYKDGASKLQYIVPSPMTDRKGVNKNGSASSRCLANTGRRRFLVVENDCGTKIEQAHILNHLASVSEHVPLRMVVDSGGKSLHGWFDVRRLEEPVIRAWFSYAVYLGADVHTWVRCQWVRMPGGTRAKDLDSKPQPVVWLCDALRKEIGL